MQLRRITSVCGLLIWRFPVFTHGKVRKKWYILQNFAFYNGTIRKNSVVEQMVTDKVTILRR